MCAVEHARPRPCARCVTKARAPPPPGWWKGRVLSSSPTPASPGEIHIPSPARPRARRVLPIAQCAGPRGPTGAQRCVRTPLSCARKPSRPNAAAPTSRPLFSSTHPAVACHSPPRTGIGTGGCKRHSPGGRRGCTCVEEEGGRGTGRGRRVRDGGARKEHRRAGAGTASRSLRARPPPTGVRR